MAEGIIKIHRAKQVAGVDPLRYSSSAAEGTAGRVIKASEGKFYRARVEGLSATQYWFMVFDKTTAPVNGDTPIYRHRLNANSGENVILFEDAGLYCALGIGVAISSTSGTLTLAVANDMLLTAHYL